VLSRRRELGLVRTNVGRRAQVAVDTRRRGGGSPTVLATNQANVTDIAVDTDTLYWASANQSSLRSLSLAAGASVVTLAVGQKPPTYIKVRNGKV
jgi:hypothetical protein